MSIVLVFSSHAVYLFKSQGRFLSVLKELVIAREAFSFPSTLLSDMDFVTCQDL